MAPIRSRLHRSPSVSGVRVWLAALAATGVLVAVCAPAPAFAGADSSRHAHHKKEAPNIHHKIRDKLRNDARHDRKRAERPVVVKREVTRSVEVTRPAVRRESRRDVRREVRHEVRHEVRNDHRLKRHAERVAHRPARHHDRHRDRAQDRHDRHHHASHRGHGYDRHHNRHRDRHHDKYKDRDSKWRFDFRIGSGHIDIGRRDGYRHGGHCDKPRGYWERRWKPPVYRWVRDRCGNYRKVCVRPGRYERVWVEVRVGGRY